MPARAAIMRFLVPGKKVAKGGCPPCAEHKFALRALFPHFPIKNAFQTIFSFFQNQNSAGFYNFDLLKRTHSAKRHKFHAKNRKPVYMLRR